MNENSSIVPSQQDDLKEEALAKNQSSSDSSKKNREENPRVQSHNLEGMRMVVQANNRLTSGLYVNISKNEDLIGKNLFFSPFSISSALAPVYEGSRGRTAHEIQNVLGLPSDDTLRREGYSTLINKIFNGESGNTLSCANAIWAEKTYPFLSGYTQIVQEYYHANATNLDFINKPEESRDVINQWIFHETNNTISDLIPSGGINPLSRIVITNAVYFKGNWADQFKPAETTDGAFMTSPESCVLVKMMHKVANFHYAENSNLQILEIPYMHGSEGEISMMILLPKADNLTDLENTIQGMNLSAIRSGLTNNKVIVEIPRFKLKSDYHLSNTLRMMGMPLAFSGSADLSGMDGSHDLFVSDVIHKAYVEVNEEGTEAAAATAVSSALYNAEGKTAPPIPVFRADHPFIFLIMDTRTDLILFMGRIENPTGGVPSSKDKPVKSNEFFGLPLKTYGSGIQIYHI